MKIIHLPVALSLLAPALAQGQVEELNGYTISDPYRNLETDEGADAWIESQHQVMEKHLGSSGVDRKAIEKRMDELSRIGGIQGPKVAGARTFYAKRQGQEEQVSLMVLEGGKERKLVDPGALDAGGKVALDWYHPSPSGKLVAYGLSRDGTEDSVLHLLDLESGEHRKDVIPHARHASLAWLRDESGFYYTRYPEDDRYNRWVYFHELGADPSKDRQVFGEGKTEKTDWPSVKLAEDGETLLIVVGRGWSASDVWTLDKGAKDARKILDGGALGALFEDPILHGGKVLVRTNHEAPRYKVVSVDPKNSDPSRWQTVLPEGDWPLDGVRLVGGNLVVASLEKAVSKLALYTPAGKLVRQVPLPDLGSILALGGEAKGDRLVIGYTSFLEPAALYEMRLADGKIRTLAEVPAPKVDEFTVSQVDYPSYDGTWVPMFVLHKKGVKLDGSNPTLLTGYGGFNISLSPRFSPAALYWVEKGGVYAVANLRGGSELGEEWHDAGKLENKHQVFRDFEFAMRHLLRNGWTRPERLAIMGGSNGGLLMGAMMTQAPELFQAAVGRVGLYDMIRFHRFLIAELWVDEYGSAENPEQTGYLLGYSPYHQVLPGVRYPAFFGLTAKSDTRVHWNHTAKFVAALQNAQGGDAPILLRVEEQAGHGQGKGRTDRVKEDAMVMQFIHSQLRPATVPAPTKR